MSGVISFVFSSPRHHAEMLLPVVRTLQQQGTACRVVSLAEFRGLETPRWDLAGARVHKVLPIRRPFKVPPPDAPSVERPRVDKRALAQRLVWRFGIGPRLRWLLRGSRVVVVPNDTAYPYLQLVSSLDVPVVLVQEGIRFPLPVESKSAYGTHAAKVCAWGAGSAEHFHKVGARGVTVTGNPRFDRLDPASYREDGERVLRSLGLASPPVVFLSNPIDVMGFSDLRGKLALFAQFLDEASPVLAAAGVPLVVKLHPYEDPEHFRSVAREKAVPVVVAADAPLFALLAASRAAVVTASTVGLEALVFGLPLGALEIPRHGYPFEYVARGAAVGLAPGTIARGVEELLHHPELRRESATALLDRHLANRGRAHECVSQAILSSVSA